MQFTTLILAIAATVILPINAERFIITNFVAKHAMFSPYSMSATSASPAPFLQAPANIPYSFSISFDMRRANTTTYACYASGRSQNETGLRQYVNYPCETGYFTWSLQKNDDGHWLFTAYDVDVSATHTFPLDQDTHYTATGLFGGQKVKYEQLTPPGRTFKTNMIV